MRILAAANNANQEENAHSADHGNLKAQRANVGITPQGNSAHDQMGEQKHIQGTRDNVNTTHMPGMLGQERDQRIAGARRMDYSMRDVLGNRHCADRRGR